LVLKINGDLVYGRCSNLRRGKHSIRQKIHAWKKSYQPGVTIHKASESIDKMPETI